MRLITNKKKAEIGKRLAAILYITIHGYGHGFKSDIEAKSKIISHVYEIAYMVGGLSFANYEVPKWFDNLKRYVDGEGGADDVVD